MARTPDESEARTEQVLVRLTSTDIHLLDQLRGGSSRSAYLRFLLKEARTKKQGLGKAPPKIVKTKPTDHRHTWVGKIGKKHCSSCGALMS